MAEAVGLELLPDALRRNYEVHEWKHACAILRGDFPDEWKDIISLLAQFELRRSWITQRGGRKSKVASGIDEYLYGLGWEKKAFSTQVVVDGVPADAPTHKVDCFRNGVALEIEWNNKDPFYDRDLNNFRLLFDLRAISVGVIITRCDELQEVFDALGRGKSYGSSTTHMSKLLPRIDGGSGGGCPILVFDISKKLYREYKWPARPMTCFAARRDENSPLGPPTRTTRKRTLAAMAFLPKVNCWSGIPDGHLNGWRCYLHPREW